jgi:acyl-CoA synthetase (AMP-forming)/AMP-acid ligase II
MTFRSLFPDVTVPNVTLHDYVLGGAAAYPDAPALVDGVSGRTLTYGMLLDQVRRLAAGLARRGIRKGDVVGIFAPNSPEYAVVFHGVSKAGAVLTTVNPTYTADELAYQLKDAGATLLVTVVALLPKAREAVAAAGRSIEIVTIDEGADAPTLDSLLVDEEPPAVAIDPVSDLMALPYSSGTTGLPKGVMLTHRNVVANLAQIDAVEVRDLKSFLGLLPFFHIYGMVVIMNFGLMRGASIVTMPRFDLEGMLKILQTWPIGVAHLVPPIVVALAKHPVVDQYKLTALQWIFCGAAPLGAELTQQAERRLSVVLRQGYGMTEASPVTHYSTRDCVRAGKVGLLVPSTEGRIVDPETGRDRGVCEPGEVWVRGPQVMKGYLNNPDATALTVDADGWLHTGDIGVMDEEGFLEIVDRLKELIKVKGFQVAPAELEAVLLKHPKIADAAVIPVVDGECGEVPKAVVVAREPIAAEDVMAFVEAHVAHYKRIRHVAFVDQIPKSPSGKILRRVLVAAERSRATP